jgi:cytoskeleton protein RodZ
LREAREKRGVSLRQIANSTRISVMSLEALERSDLSRLPGGIFTRAFIRAYAQEVGLDPERMIQDFIAELPAESVAATARSSSMEDGEQLESDRKAVATAMKLILVSLPIAGFVIYYGMQGSRTAPATPPAGSTGTGATAGGDSAVTETPSSPVPPAATPDASVMQAVASGSQTQPTGLTMEIAPKADCWVSVTVDGDPAFSVLLHPGDKRRVVARDEISLNVGDAGAFAYTINGKEGRPLGAPGEVVSKRITLADSRNYITP